MTRKTKNEVMITAEDMLKRHFSNGKNTRKITGTNCTVGAKLVIAEHALRTSECKAGVKLAKKVDWTKHDDQLELIEDTVIEHLETCRDCSENMNFALNVVFG